MHEFSGTFRGGPATFRVTSVKGHVYNLVFTPEWWAHPLALLHLLASPVRAACSDELCTRCPPDIHTRARAHTHTSHCGLCAFGVPREAWDVDPQLLFGAETTKVPTSGAVCAHLEHEAKGADHLVLWLDCDREGENICFEVAPHRSLRRAAPRTVSRRLAPCAALRRAAPSRAAPPCATPRHPERAQLSR